MFGFWCLEGLGYRLLEVLSAWIFGYIRAFLGFRGFRLEAFGGFECLDFWCSGFCFVGLCGFRYVYVGSRVFWALGGSMLGLPLGVVEGSSSFVRVWGLFEGVSGISENEPAVITAESRSRNICVITSNTKCLYMCIYFEDSKPCI